MNDHAATLSHNSLPRERAMLYDRTGFKELPLQDAITRWMQYKKIYIKDRSLEAYAYYSVALLAFFGEAYTLATFQPDHWRSFQEWRIGNGAVSVINHETNMLAQMLKYAGLWSQWRDFCKYLSAPKRNRRKRVLTPAQEESLFTWASSNPKWEVAYLVTLITNNTTASGMEIRNLQLKDLWLHKAPPILSIESGKNDYRPREIPLNQVAVQALTMALQRADRVGSYEPEHYLFPLSPRRNVWNPAKPPSRSFIRKQWSALCKAAGMPGLQYRWLRDHCITKMLENPRISQETVQHISGWSSLAVKEVYSDIRMDAKREAVEELAKQGFKPKREVISFDLLKAI